VLGEVLTRTSPVHAIIRGAADAEEFALDLRRRLLEVRVTTLTKMVRNRLAGTLRPGLTYKMAGERLAALASPELFHLVTVELGWSVEHYQHWLAELLTRDLLDLAEQCD
jgi:hypothetical protein